MAVVTAAQLGAAVTLVTTAETVALVLPADPVDLAAPLGRLIRGVLNVTAGTGTTAVVIRVRAGSTTGGALVGAANTHTLAAAAVAQIAFSELDAALAAPANNQYCVTVQQTAATGNGTVNDGSIELDTPSPQAGGI